MAPTSSAYIDSAGRPQLRPSIVGFLDLLGFSQRVTSASRSGDSQQLLDLIASAISDSRNFVRQVMIDSSAENPTGWAVKFFSDNLVLGYAFEESGQNQASAAWFVIRCSQQYQLRMALNGMFLRGGLTCGPVCMTDEIIFGSALIECYELESKASIVPRVLLSEPLVKVVRDSYELADSGLASDARESICRDVDGWWFVNYLQAAIREKHVDWSVIQRHKQNILESLTSTTRHDVLPKFGWACRYHNMFCHWHCDDPGFDDRFRIHRDDDRSAICRLGDAD
jgi:hypothetical protein